MDIEFELIDGVKIPYLTLELLLKTKQGLRDQDAQDRIYLERLVHEKGMRQLKNDRR